MVIGREKYVLRYIEGNKLRVSCVTVMFSRPVIGSQEADVLTHVAIHTQQIKPFDTSGPEYEPG